jgi:hypothetical protein
VERLGFVGFLLRLALAAVLVVLTFNPTGHSYYHWLAHTLPPTPPVVVAGLALVIGWVVFLGATLRSLGAGGTVLVLAFIGAVVWLVVWLGWLDPRNASALSWVVLVAVVLLLAIGVSWSHLRRRLTGQADVDEVDSR